uniref:disease resistance protein Roq1-like n=1 Tax=Erigeron canadensis TaxID=72917 RepID=UPI001CB94431|nr:disease resistance protein Roq1-like [Erigeron canadensis]
MLSMTEITVGGLIVSAVVVILTTIIFRLFSRYTSNNGDGVDTGAAGGLRPLVPTISNTSIGSWKYDVFLSFRGEDTRKNFVDHLYSALDQHGILTYKDDVTLDRGDTIGPSLLKAIGESQILMIIFSENYADSSWCLDELSHIMECKDSKMGQIVFPIFYHVDPSDVRKQKGQFGKAFAKAKHKLSKNNKVKVESWKKALGDATNIAGWEPKQVANGHEAKCIQEIVGSILVKLSSLESVVEEEGLVGMGTRLKDLKQVLRIGSGGVRIVGIWGVGGGGKTTLATSLYRELKISGQFHGCCFVENIREESKQRGLKSLQEKILSTVFNKELKVESVDIGKHTTKGMLCRRNVLIVLDDVDHLDQLKALAGRHDWFGDGSRILITTRNEQVLISHRVDEVYPVSLLSHDEATQLFDKHAYNEDNHLQDYEMLSQQIVSYADGLPLALIVLGSFLYDKDNEEWIGTLSRLKDHPEMDIVEKLKISYDGLKPVEKELFLDIACFFRRKINKDKTMKILDACGFHPAIGVKVLIQKALLTVSEYGQFDMHDLVQEMAHYIVRGEHPNDPEKHSRVWRYQDIEDLCSRNATTENDKIEAISSHNVSSSDFIMVVSNMKKLRFLRVSTRDCHGGPSFLSNELRYIEWTDYPETPFPESFQPRKLAFLKMDGSCQRVLWKGYKYLPCLKELDLSWMEALERTPDFGGLPCLQKLILNECDSLRSIHPSLGNHSSLVYVDVSFCHKLTTFPSIVGMKMLEIITISNCKALVEFPKIECRQLIHSHFPGFLRKLNLKGCGLKDDKIPCEVGELSNLQELDLSYNHFTRLNFSLSRLASLKLLELSYCVNLVELPELPSSLAILNAYYCYYLEAIIKDEIHTNCKWLSQVLIWGRGQGQRQGWAKNKDIIGGERILETMLQGNDIESRCMSLQLKGLEIPRGFEPRVVRGRRCRMQLPENWYNDFSGFLLYAASNDLFEGMKISMKHKEEEENGCWMEMGNSEHDLYREEDRVDVDDDDYGIGYSWVGYIPFNLLRHTSWWDPTSNAIWIEMDSYYHVSGCGLKLVPKRGGESSSSSSGQMEISLHDHYKCKLVIQHDSKSVLECRFDHYGLDQNDY